MGYPDHDDEDARLRAIAAEDGQAAANEVQSRDATNWALHVSGMTAGLDRSRAESRALEAQAAMDAAKASLRTAIARLLRTVNFALWLALVLFAIYLFLAI
jgi:hypothetical protein